jgi:hypothetical protein
MALTAKRLGRGATGLIAGLLVAVCAVCAVCWERAAVASAAPPRASVAVAARTCKPPHYPSVGYFDSLTATRTTCATADKLVLAYFKCRTKSGLAGRCKVAVLGFKCTETRNSIPTEIDARDTCKKGQAKVISVWQQDIS